jgi:hypothetical protein
MAKLASPYLQKNLQECAAFHIMAEMYELKLMKQADQYNFLFSKYHGMAQGSVSAVCLILAGEGRYAELWQKTSSPMELSIQLPGKLTNRNGGWYTREAFSVASLSNTNNKSNIKISGRNILDKEKKALKNCKKYLAIYNSMLDLKGSLPSANAEDDIIFEVLHDLYVAKAGDKKDDSDADEVEQEDGEEDDDTNNNNTEEHQSNEVSNEM